MLVKLTYLRCNALFNKRAREAATMLESGQVYMQVLNKAIKDTQRKANAHCSWVWSTRHTILGPGDNKSKRGLAYWRLNNQSGWKVVWLWKITEIAHALFSCCCWLYACSPWGHELHISYVYVGKCLQRIQRIVWRIIQWSVLATMSRANDMPQSR